jgi:hypothetical protein
MKIACRMRRRSSLARYVKKNMPPFYAPAGFTAVTPPLGCYRLVRLVQRFAGVTGVQPRGREAGVMDDEFDARADDENEDKDENEDEDDQPGAPWPAPSEPRDVPGRWHRTRRRGVLFAVTAVSAAAAGYGVGATALHDLSSSPAAASSTPPGGAAPTLTPSTPSAGSGNGAGAAPGLIPSTGNGQTLHLEIGSKVAAVSATSITLGGPGRQVTAAVTSATKVTGKVASIAGVKVGDLVVAQITGTDGKLTVTAIQDPASIP